MALLYSRTSKVQSFHQGYPRKAVEEVRADPPSPRLHSLMLMKHLLLCHKLPLKTPARPGILSLAPHRHCSAQLTPLCWLVQLRARTQTIPKEDTTFLESDAG